MVSRTMMNNYGRAPYSEETLKRWAEQQKKDREFAERHSQETTKDYEVKGFIVRCIQRKYDVCMKKRKRVRNPDLDAETGRDYRRLLFL